MHPAIYVVGLLAALTYVTVRDRREKKRREKSQKEQRQWEESRRARTPPR